MQGKNRDSPVADIGHVSRRGPSCAELGPRELAAVGRRKDDKELLERRSHARMHESGETVAL